MLVLRREDGDWTNATHVASGDVLRVVARRFRLVGGVRMVADFELEDGSRHFAVKGPGVERGTSTYRVDGDPRLLCRQVVRATCGCGDWLHIVHRDGDRLGLMVVAVDRADVQLGFEDDARNYFIERPECRKRHQPPHESPNPTPSPIP